MTLEILPVAMTAVPIGMVFGIILERTGLGDPRVIAGQLTGRDFTVVRVMFGAIVTAMLGLAWGSAAGWLDTASIAIPPTALAAQAIGAIIFGGGFALAALCPGTACVAASSGRRDGFAAIAGLLVGTLVTALIWPVFGDLVTTAPRERALLPDDLGVSRGVTVLAVTALGIVASVISRRRDRRQSADPIRLTTPETVAIVLAATFFLVDDRLSIAEDRVVEIAGEIAGERDHVEALNLAEWIRAGTPGLRIIDVRDDVDADTYIIPGAEVIPLDSLATLTMSRDSRMILYSQGGTHAAQAWVLLRARGLTNLFVLHDGLAAWEDEVMSPVRPAIASDTALARYLRAKDLSIWFGGMPRGVPLPDENGTTRDASQRRRRNTC